MVDIQLVQRFKVPVTLAALRKQPELESMQVLRKGNRLSVQPVTKREFDAVVKLGKG